MPGNAGQGPEQKRKRAGRLCRSYSLAAATELACLNRERGKNGLSVADMEKRMLGAFWRTKARKRRGKIILRPQTICGAGDRRWKHGMHGNIFAQLHITKIWCCRLFKIDYTGIGAAAWSFKNILLTNGRLHTFREPWVLLEQCRAEYAWVFFYAVASQRTQ